MKLIDKIKNKKLLRKHKETAETLADVYAAVAIEEHVVLRKYKHAKNI